MSKQYPISHITNGQATTLKFNKPIRLILSALNDLSARLDGMNNKSAVLQWNVTISSDAALGDLVYFDSQNGSCFRPALARLSGQPGSQGQSVLAPSSRVLGLLISADPAVILRSGYYESSIITATIGVGALAGLYYLSPSVAGKATLSPGWNMRQPCISYYGDGKFSILTNYLAHDNHHHTYTKVEGYTEAQYYTGSDSVLGNYVWLVDTSTTGELSPLTSVVFYQGSLASDAFKIGKTTVWYTALQPPASDTICVFNVYPFAYGDSVVRSIGTDTLKVSSSRGAVKIDMPLYTYNRAVNAASAVSRIDGDSISITPVVSSIRAGQGIYAANIGSGRYVIASSNNIGTPVQATLMYMNGAQRVATSLLTYTTFPKNVDSSVVISMPVLNSTGVVFDVYTWAQIKADTGCLLDVELYWLPFSTTQAQTIPVLPISSTTLQTSAGTANTIVYIENKFPGITISLLGTLIAKLKSNGPLLDVYVYQTGFRLLAVDAEQINRLYSDSTILNTLANVLTYNAEY